MTQDKTKAFEWYLKSAQNGDTDGMYRVGCCYDHGEGVEQDDTKAYEWYLKAAENGHGDAMDIVGLCHCFGTGFSGDFEFLI